MSFLVSDDCLQLGLRAGAIAFRNVRIGEASPELRAEIAAGVAEVRARYADAAAVRSSAEVVAYHDILRKVGVNPRKLQNSVDRLLNYALKRGDLPAINSLVDAYNLVSIRTACSLGAHDLDLIASPASLRLLTGQEAFTPLGSDTLQTVIAGEFGYVDDRDRLLCRLDVLQAEFSKVTPASTNVLLIVEATAQHAPSRVRDAFDQVIDIVTRHCGGTAAIVRPALDPA